MAFPIFISLTCQSCAIPHAPRSCVQEQPCSLAGLTATAVGAPSPTGTPAALRGASGRLQPCGCVCHGVCPACGAGSPGDAELCAGKRKVVKLLQAKFSLCSPLVVLFAKAGIQSLASLALHEDIHGSVFLGRAPRRTSCPGRQGELCKARPLPFAQPQALSPCKGASCGGALDPTGCGWAPTSAGC